MADVRILLTDKAIARLPVPKEGWYLARDTELKGFFVVVGKRKRTFTVQGDVRHGKKRVSSVRVAVGDTSEISTRTARATAKDYLAQISRGQHPNAEKRGLGVGQPATGDATASSGGITLRQAWERYRDEKWGNDLRQSFRTIATAAGVSEFDAKLLMNHAIPGVNAGYITRHKLLEDHLRRQQQAISSAVFATLAGLPVENLTIRDWFDCGTARRVLRDAKLNQPDSDECPATVEPRRREAA
jgi:hypothetical protein